MNPPPTLDAYWYGLRPHARPGAKALAQHVLSRSDHASLRDTGGRTPWHRAVWSNPDVALLIPAAERTARDGLGRSLLFYVWAGATKPRSASQSGFPGASFGHLTDSPWNDTAGRGLLIQWQRYQDELMLPLAGQQSLSSPDPTSGSAPWPGTPEQWLACPDPNDAVRWADEASARMSRSWSYQNPTHPSLLATWSPPLAVLLAHDGSWNARATELLSPHPRLVSVLGAQLLPLVPGNAAASAWVAAWLALPENEWDPAAHAAVATVQKTQPALAAYLASHRLEKELPTVPAERRGPRM